MLNGYEIIEDVNMIEFVRWDVVKRTWVERVFTRPWHPFKTTRNEAVYQPMPRMIKFGNKLIMHPEVKQRLLDTLAKENDPYGWGKIVADLIAKEEALGDKF